MFEIDHPVAQRTKLDRLAASKITIGENVTYIPMDFTVDSIQATLAAGATRLLIGHNADESPAAAQHLA